MPTCIQTITLRFRSGFKGEPVTNPQRQVTDINGGL
jgi:hypothetical protein